MMLTSLSKRKVHLAFGSAMAILLVVGVISHRGMVASNESNRWVGHTHEVLENLQALLYGMAAVASTVRRYVLTGEDAALEAYRVSRANLARHEEIVRALTLDNPGQQHRLTVLERLAAESLQRAESIIVLRREQGFQAAVEVAQGGPSLQVTGLYETIVRELREEELRLLALHEADVERHSVWTKSILALGTVLGFVITGIAGWSVQRDNSRRELAEEALFSEKERAQVTLDSIGDAVACADISGNLTFLNAVGEKMTGWSEQDAAGRPVAEVLRIVDAESGEAIPNPMEMALRQNRSLHLPANCVLVRRDGSKVPIEDSVAPIHDRHGRPIGAVIVFRDVTVAREMARQIAHAAKHDFLTGLPNRMLLNDRIGQAIALAPRHRTKVAVLFLDLDGFKQINDSLGHLVGDKLLQSVAERLTDCVRASDTVSRQGGDEFVVLLSELQNLEDAAATARRMLRAVAQAHSIDAHDIRVTTSIGISVYPDDGLDAETLIKHADIAMYQAKENGRQGYRIFEAAPDVPAEERRAVM